MTQAPGSSSCLSWKGIQDKSAAFKNTTIKVVTSDRFLIAVTIISFVGGAFAVGLGATSIASQAGALHGHLHQLNALGQYAIGLMVAGGVVASLGTICLGLLINRVIEKRQERKNEVKDEVLAAEQEVKAAEAEIKKLEQKLQDAEMARSAAEAKHKQAVLTKHEEAKKKAFEELEPFYQFHANGVQSDHLVIIPTEQNTYSLLFVYTYGYKVLKNLSQQEKNDQVEQLEKSFTIVNANTN